MCNSAVQCGSKKAQSFGVNESTIEYLAKMTTTISPSFPEGRRVCTEATSLAARGEENQPYDIVHKFMTNCVQWNPAIRPPR